MKSFLLPLLFFIAHTGAAQSWQGELMTGAMAYNGDLTQNDIPFNRLKPAASLKLIYNSGDYVNFRLGVGYGKVSGDDKKNKSYFLTDRNLSFESSVVEATFCAEFNLFDPEIYNNFPYVFFGAGVFHFNPYAYDKDNKKTFLHPLTTEGQGLQQYPDRKKYSLTQFCIPFGTGMRFKQKTWEFGFEVGFRLIFTDYLDDVSSTYVTLESLTTERGAKAAEMSFRSTVIPFPGPGEVRGNTKKRDTYFFSGLRFVKTFGKSSNKKKEKKDSKEDPEKK